MRVDLARWPISSAGRRPGLSTVPGTSSSAPASASPPAARRRPPAPPR